MFIFADDPPFNVSVLSYKSEAGATVGLIDSLISICRVLHNRDLESSPEVCEALHDLREDEDVRKVMGL